MNRNVRTREAMPLCCRSFTSRSRSLYFVPSYPLSSSLLFSLIPSFPSLSSPLPQLLPWVDKKCAASPHRNIQIDHAFAPLATSPQSSSQGDKTGKLCCPSYPPSEVCSFIPYIIRGNLVLTSCTYDDRQPIDSPRLHAAPQGPGPFHPPTPPVPDQPLRLPGTC
jgi:hypothetical protein